MLGLEREGARVQEVSRVALAANALSAGDCNLPVLSPACTVHGSCHLCGLLADRISAFTPCMLLIYCWPGPAGWRVRATAKDVELACRVMGSLSEPLSRENEVRQRGRGRVVSGKLDWHVQGGASACACLTQSQKSAQARAAAQRHATCLGSSGGGRQTIISAPAPVPLLLQTKVLAALMSFTERQLQRYRSSLEQDQQEVQQLQAQGQQQWWV